MSLHLNAQKAKIPGWCQRVMSVLRWVAVPGLLQTGEVIHHYPGLSDDENLALWRIDASLDELVTWTKNNHYISELTCEQRELYRIEPMCESEEQVDE